MASTVWKGYISFGLVSVPVRLYVAARDTHISFHMLHKECGTRVKQQLWCPQDERVVQRNEIVKGFAVDKNTNIIVEDAELKDLQAESSEVMEILQFVKNEDLDPIYFETSYYSVPEPPGKRAYALLMQTMEEKGVFAVAKITLHQRERVVTIRPYDKGLTLHTLYYSDEVREIEDYGQDQDAKISPKELALAGQFVDELIKPFDPEEYKDTYEERVAELIESKSEGKAAPTPIRKPHLAPVVDLMEALQKSLAKKQQATSIDASKKKPVQRATAAKSRRKAS